MLAIIKMKLIFLIIYILVSFFAECFLYAAQRCGVYAQ